MIVTNIPCLVDDMVTNIPCLVDDGNKHPLFSLEIPRWNEFE